MDKEKRNRFTWILSGSEKFDKVIIEIGDIQFRIIISMHKGDINMYNANVDRFLCEANSDNEIPLGALGMQSTTSTAHQTGIHSPTLQPPIYITQREIGSGAFSVVSRVWDVSTGAVYAAKDLLSRGKLDVWREEASIMTQALLLENVENIIKIIAFIETPSPRLILEYLPLGNLEDQHTQRSLSEEEGLSILCQSLNALVAIHEDGIVHRDIKPANILVQSRDPLHIKLADFGLSKSTSDLETVCGTGVYAAPEIFTSKYYYTKACDIWSLGVVILQYVYRFPVNGFESFPSNAGERRSISRWWCANIIKFMLDWDSEPLLDILSSMLVMEPKNRLPARRCWEQALQLLHSTSQSRDSTPTQASHHPSSGVVEPHGTMPKTSFAVHEAVRTQIGDYNKQWQDHEGCTGTSNELDTQTREPEARKMKRKIDIPDLPRCTRSPSPNVQTTLKRTRRGHDLDFPDPRSVDGRDIFGPMMREQVDETVEAQTASTPRFEAVDDPSPPPVLQTIRLDPRTKVICATQLIKASSKRLWPVPSILGPYKFEVKSYSGEYYISYADGIALASRLELPTERLQAAMEKCQNHISIEVCQEETHAADALIVHIIPSESLINATNLLRLRRRTKTPYLPKLLQDSGIQSVQIRTGKMQGTFVSYEDGIRLCHVMGLSEDRLCQIQNAITERWIGPMVQVQYLPTLNNNELQLKLVAQRTDAFSYLLADFQLPLPSSEVMNELGLNQEFGSDELSTPALQPDDPLAADWPEQPGW